MGIKLTRTAPTLSARPQAATPEPVPSSLEDEARAEIDAVARGFRERGKAEAARFRDNTDSEYWVCMGFQSREQKEEFLGALGLLAHGDKYLDGLKVAKALGIDLKTEVPPMPKFRVDGSWGRFALPKG